MTLNAGGGRRRVGGEGRMKKWEGKTKEEDGAGGRERMATVVAAFVLCIVKAVLV